MKIEKFCVLILIAAAAAFAFSCASTGGGAGGSAEGSAPVYSWNFGDSAPEAGGWVTVPDEFWDFKGTIKLSLDSAAMGKPMLRVDVDYSKDVDSWWSEPKIKYEFAKPFETKGVKRFVYDMYFNKQFSTTGAFKGKAFFLDDKTSVAVSELDSIIANEQVGDYMKATVAFRFSASRPINGIVLGIVGAVTDYNGPIFIDNMRME